MPITKRKCERCGGKGCEDCKWLGEIVSLGTVEDVLRLKNWSKGKMEKKVKWISDRPEKCDLCGRPLVDWFVDGKTTYGPWAVIGKCCFDKFGVGLGTGRGQRYDLETLEKIEG